ncbi:tubulin-specific chaperone A-like [Convolutriloba macropyga]|uniref:tubulin-specific chaperone A-like n=1 Tax=Convolutriloba macropyga TaxID=536237 RepID=UPI003F5213C9
MADGDSAANAPVVDKNLLKSIKIKTGVVKRIHKEGEYYVKEAEKLKKKVEQMKVDGADEYDVRKQEEVAQESESMIPDSDRRLKVAIEDLKNVLSGISDSDSATKETTEYKTAIEVLDTAQSK